MIEHKFKRQEENSGALINTDLSALESYKLKKKQNERINNLENRLENIEKLLIQLIEKKINGIT